MAERSLRDHVLDDRLFEQIVKSGAGVRERRRGSRINEHHQASNRVEK